MKTKIKIVIADDHPMVAEGVHVLLEKQDDIEVVGEARDGRELVELVEEKRPDVAIVDIEMPKMNGAEATKEIKKRFEGVKVIAFTAFNEEHWIVDMMEAGANGYLLKTSDKEELAEAIRTVHEGNNYFCKATTFRLSKMIAESKSDAVRRMNRANLSEKEKEIVRLICEQFASKEIAGMTNLTHRTVEKYRDNIMEKTGAKNVVGIVIYAIRNGIFRV